jgi:hypothetical protein
MPPAELEPATPAIELLQIYALDHTTIGIYIKLQYSIKELKEERQCVKKRMSLLWCPSEGQV